MSVFRRHKTRDFTVMSNHHFKNNGLSYKAKGILSAIFSLPDDWKITISGLSKLAKDSETSVSSGIDELIKAGYIIRSKHRNRDSKGFLCGYTYDVYETPFVENNDVTENEDVNPRPDFPRLDYPRQDYPRQDNVEHLNTNTNKELNNKELNNSLKNNKKDSLGELDQDRKEKKDSSSDLNLVPKNMDGKKKTSARVDLDFDTFFWNVYGKKVGKEECESLWFGKKKTTSRGGKKPILITPEIQLKISQHLPGFVLSKPDKQYRPNPLTYLNGKMWEDEVIIDGRPDGPHQDRPDKYEAMKKRGGFR